MAESPTSVCRYGCAALSHTNRPPEIMAGTLSMCVKWRIQRFRAVPPPVVVAMASGQLPCAWPQPGGPEVAVIICPASRRRLPWRGGDRADVGPGAAAAPVRGGHAGRVDDHRGRGPARRRSGRRVPAGRHPVRPRHGPARDRKSTRLNSSHSSISYAVFCLKKKKKKIIFICTTKKTQKNK